MVWLAASISDLLIAARSNTWTTIITVFSFSFVYVQYRRSPWRKLPPGPKGIPILGNIFQLGKTQWFTFTEWRKEYGDVVYLNLAGQPAVVLNSLKAAADILDRRAGLNSDRPSYIVASEMMSRNMFMGFTPYNDLWRTMRRASHEGLHKAVTPNFHPTQMKEAAILASEIISTPKNWDNHLRRAATSVIASIVYDTPTLKSEEDPLVMEVNQFTARLTKAALPGAHFVESFPWMKYIPASLAKWKQIALESYKKDTSMLTGLMQPVRNQIASGEDRPSFSATVINDKSHNMTEAESAWLAGSVYAAGAETTSAVMAWWVLGVIAYPETLKKARAEIDSVVGRDRMPTFDDFEHLPYIRAMAKEVLRWRPVTPLGSPHRSTEDDTSEGHFIPANTILISNI
ncbi:hypothetical protein NLJ89_g3687 [Agrocybe chaxingu]|uniref:Cytochrome P450 n=1 Tax=Agrocybe chaxingu TaxID=84603 RepID=A0A9W8K9L9_9AGAR|nr:hypothetical protein NLJ89_g3687 [Agrocybe chaxingu]